MEESKPHTVTAAIRTLMETNMPWLFIPGSLLLSIAGSALYDLVLKPMGVEPSARSLMFLLAGSLVGIVVIALALATWFRRKLGRSAFLGGPALEKDRRAIIFTVGFQKDTIVKAIDGQKPEFLGLLQSSASKSTADSVLQQFTFEETKIERKGVDAYDFSQVRSETIDIIKTLMWRHNMREGDIVVDLTGGTVPMSIGAYRAAEELGIDTQYVTSDFDENNRPRQPKEIILITEYARVSSKE